FHLDTVRIQAALVEDQGIGGIFGRLLRIVRGSGKQVTIQRLKTIGKIRVNRIGEPEQGSPVGDYLLRDGIGIYFRIQEILAATAQHQDERRQGKQRTEDDLPHGDNFKVRQNVAERPRL